MTCIPSSVNATSNPALNPALLRNISSAPVNGGRPSDVATLASRAVDPSLSATTQGQAWRDLEGRVGQQEARGMLLVARTDPSSITNGATPEGTGELLVSQAQRGRPLQQSDIPIDPQTGKPTLLLMRLSATVVTAPGQATEVGFANQMRAQGAYVEYDAARNENIILVPNTLAGGKAVQYAFERNNRAANGNFLQPYNPPMPANLRSAQFNQGIDDAHFNSRLVSGMNLGQAIMDIAGTVPRRGSVPRAQPSPQARNAASNNLRGPVTTFLQARSASGNGWGVSRLGGDNNGSYQPSGRRFGSIPAGASGVGGGNGRKPPPGRVATPSGPNGPFKRGQRDPRFPINAAAQAQFQQSINNGEEIFIARMGGINANGTARPVSGVQVLNDLPSRVQSGQYTTGDPTTGVSNVRVGELPVVQVYNISGQDLIRQTDRLSFEKPSYMIRVRNGDPRNTFVTLPPTVNGLPGRTISVAELYQEQVRGPERNSFGNGTFIREGGTVFLPRNTVIHFPGGQGQAAQSFTLPSLPR